MIALKIVNLWLKFEPIKSFKSLMSIVASRFPVMLRARKLSKYSLTNGWIPKYYRYFRVLNSRFYNLVILNLSAIRKHLLPTISQCLTAWDIELLFLFCLSLFVALWIINIIFSHQYIIIAYCSSLNIPIFFRLYFPL